MVAFNPHPHPHPQPWQLAGTSLSYLQFVLTASLSSGKATATAEL